MPSHTLETQNHAEPHIGLIHIAVHGHFYQPSREDPFTGMIPQESGAAPFPNYNEKITAECYRPNAESGNFNVMSFDVGPTLAGWLEKAHPDVLEQMVLADRRHRNGLAQAYHHTILPLMSEQDKRTQVLWGREDFRHRFGRQPRGMWVAETAIDLATLDVLAAAGIQFTVLAPWQVKGPVDPTEPYVVRLKEGRSMAVFVYNDLSGAVSYNDDATTDANSFAALYQRTYLNREKARAGVPQIHVIATDGELYGHHKPWRDRFLAHFLQHSAPAYGLEPCSLERYLDACPPITEIEIREPSSWSCWHGIARWCGECECGGTVSDEQRAWKRHLRQALVRLQEEGNKLFEDYASYALDDPWAARDQYIPLRNGWEAPERFWARHGISSRLDIEHIQAARNLLESQYSLQCSMTSCGFFFEDLDRIEPKNALAAARRAISLMWVATGYDLQKDFVKDLQKVRSWRTGRTGADLYGALPNIPRWLLPPSQES